MTLFPLESTTEIVVPADIVPLKKTVMESWEEVSEGDCAMPELPAKVCAWLAAHARLAPLPVALATDSADGFTRKYLLGLADGRRIETVLMRYTGRVTACISSQAGCAMGCVFCATGQMGFARHLTAGEIIAQAMHIDRVLRGTAAAAACTTGRETTTDHMPTPPIALIRIEIPSRTQE